MAVMGVGGPGIGDHVYQNMVRRYRICVDVGGRHIEPFLYVDPEDKQQEWESDRERESNVCSGKRYVSRHEFLC